MMTEKNIAVIPTNLALVLRPALNGGWVIEQVQESHLLPSLIGAFTTPADMLAALNEAFYPQQGIDEAWLNSVRQATGFASQMEDVGPVPAKPENDDALVVRAIPEETEE